MTPDERMARRLIRLLLEEHGYAAVVRMADEEAGDNGPKPRRRSPSYSLTDAARAAAEGLAPDELAAARARRAKKRLGRG